MGNTGENSSAGILQRASKIISDVFNPLVSLLFYFAYFSYVHLNFSQAAAAYLPIFFIVGLPVALFIFYMVKSGRYGNADVSDRSQRKSLYFFTEILLAVYLLFAYFFRKYPDYPMMFSLVLLVCLQISNYFIKSSMHTAFNVYVAALFLAQNILLGIVWLGISFLVAASRLILRRHTVGEIISGFLIAVAVSAVYLYIQIQITR